MKSNEEFIAGIYEKAAAYTEEKETKIVKVNWSARATKIAAMVAVCIGLAGAGTLVLGGSQRGNDAPEMVSEEYGIALLSEDVGEEAGTAMQFRRMPVAEIVTFTGIVDSVDMEEKRIWITLEFDESAPEHAEGSMVCIKWDMLEEISAEIAEGVRVTATGVLSVYENADSGQNGCAELVLTDMADIRYDNVTE